MMHPAYEHPLGKCAGYNPKFAAKAKAKRLREKMKVLPGRSRAAQAHRMFHQGMDTLEIAHLMLITEPEAVKLLDQARDKLIERYQAA